ncbi:MAG: DNA alkylation repair protein [Verrucomicrobiae bacterium]|nr:DNA alkylation repair protein [Verrucomicrobiae bacterium]
MKSPSIRKQLHSFANPAKAAILQRFFKTGPGEYGEGDVFIGVVVPTLRKLAAQGRDLPMEQVRLLLRSPIHEERLLALLILVIKFQKGGEGEQGAVFRFYCRHLRWINNWDLVDLSAPQIVGGWLLDRDKTLLFKLASSKHLWSRRIAILATFAFLRQGRFNETFAIAKKLLHDPHDLIHKAVGWMLRETGKRNLAAEEKFLKIHSQKMPRTMLRYAIERFPKAKRKKYMRHAPGPGRRF